MPDPIHWASLKPTEARTEGARAEQQFINTQANLISLQGEHEDLKRKLETAESKVSNLEILNQRLRQELDDSKVHVRSLEDRQAMRGNGSSPRSRRTGLWALLLAALILGILLGAFGLFGWQTTGLYPFNSGIAAVEEVVPPPADEAPAPVPDESEPAAVDPTATDNEEPGSSSNEEPARLIPVNGDDVKPTVAAPKLSVSETSSRAEDPCDVELIGDLEKYFDYREWNKSHITTIEEALEKWNSAEATAPISYRDYEFWGDDGPNLRAFIRDQRFGYVEDGHVIYVSDTVRYTVFRCECGITAIYRETRIVYTPPQKQRPPTRKRPPVIPSDDIPKTWCIDLNTNIRKACA